MTNKEGTNTTTLIKSGLLHYDLSSAYFKIQIASGLIFLKNLS